MMDAKQGRRPDAPRRPDVRGGKPLPVAVRSVPGSRVPAAPGAPNPHYERIGGAPAIARLVEAFYRAMDTQPGARAIRALHPQDLAGARDKLFAYLVGWLGGPPLYVERHGHPRLRQRHQSFPIGAAERDAWLACMDAALAQVVADASFRDELRRAFAKVADSVRNR